MVSLVGVGHIGTVVQVVLMAVFIDVLVIITLISDQVIVYISLLDRYRQRLKVVTLPLPIVVQEHVIIQYALWFNTWSGLCSNGQLSHWSPTPSMSVSFWSVLYTYGQLSFSFRISEEKGQLLRI